MAKEFSRNRRVGEQMQRELALLIQREIKDPRLGLVTVSGVELSRDLAYAKVYITSLSGDRQQSLAILKQSAGFLRHGLGQAIRLRIVPELHFYYDESVEYGAKIAALLHEVISADPDGSSDGSDGSIESSQ